MSAEVGPSTSSTPSVSLRGDAESVEKPSSLIGQPIMDTLGSVVPIQSSLVEPRINKRRDRSPTETSDGRAGNSRGNTSSDRGNPSKSNRGKPPNSNRGNPSDQGSPGDFLDSAFPATAGHSISLKDITQSRSSHQVVYHKGHPTSNAILLYNDTKREVVQQCIANLMSQFHDHCRHVEVIADSYKGIFEDKHIALHPHDASKCYWCENWASWPRHTFIEHLKLIYPQILNVADKTFLAMIKDLKFEYDLDNISVDTCFLSELREITDHYDTRTPSEEVEAVKLLIEKINVVNTLNWQPYFDAMALQCDIKMPIAVVNDIRFLIQHTIAEARKIRIQAANYGYIVPCCNKTRVVDFRHPYKYRNNNNNNINNNNGRTQSGPSNSRPPCTICGMNNHTTSDCRTKQNEFANHSDRPIIGSKSHKRLVSLFGKRDMIPKFSDLQVLRRLASEPSSSSSSTYAPKKPYVKKDWKNEGTVRTTIIPDELPIPTSPNLISVLLTFSSQAETQGRINVENLLDTGCLAGDFVAT